MTRPIDLGAASRFLEALTGRSGPAVTFQAFDDSKLKRPELARIFNGTLEEHTATLSALNERGAGIFVTVNDTNLTGRKLENIMAVRALFIDADGPLGRPFALTPDIVVNSGRGTHAYWTVKDTPLEEFTPSQRQLAKFYGTDPAVSDLPRVMRLPGFWHCKGDPVPVTLSYAAAGDAVNTAAAVRWVHPVEADPLPVAPAAPLARAAAPPELAQRVFRASRYLSKVDGAVSGQQGHQITWDAAQALVRGFSLPVEIALDLMAQEFNPRCSPPWSDKELRHKVEDAAAKSALPDGYLLEAGAAPAPPRIAGVPVAGGAAPVRPAALGPPAAPPAASPLAPVASPLAPAATPAPAITAAEEHLLRALFEGMAVEGLVPLLAEIRNEVTRDTMVKRIAHERNVSPTAVFSEVKKVIRARRKLRSVVEGPPGEAPLPEIRLEPGQLPAIVGKAEEALVASPGVPVYQRGNVLVRVFRTESVTVWRRRRRGPNSSSTQPAAPAVPAEPVEPPLFERPAGALVIHPVENAYLVDRFTSAATWLKFDGRAMDWRPADCPPRVADVYLARAGAWNVRTLIGIIEAPTLRPDGSILEAPGYDEETGLLYDPGDTVFPVIPQSPSREEGRVALDRLLVILAEFPFVTPADRSAALSALLTGLVRKSLKTAPLHAFRAPKMRVGKSLLADLVSMLATGRSCAVLSQNWENADEEKKRLLAILLAGDPVICYDNIDKPFGGAALCQALTQEMISDRILGATAMATAPTAVTFLATGNNLIFEADITSRVVPCDLDPEVERPEEREFTLQLDDYMPAHRGELVVAALTALRAYHVAGRPSMGIPRWGGFEDWSDLVRSTIVWLDQADPAEGRHRIEDLDPVRRQLRTVLTTWHESFGSKTVTVNEAIKEAQFPVHEDLKNAFLDVAGVRGDIDSRKLARFLTSHEKRIEAGFRFVRTGMSHQAVVWGVVSAAKLGEFGESRKIDHGKIDNVETLFSTNELPVQHSKSLQVGTPGSYGESTLYSQSTFCPESISTKNIGTAGNDSSGLPNSPTPSQGTYDSTFTCIDCSGHLFRTSKKGSQVCTACWGGG